MKSKQYSVKVFETTVTDEKQFMEFFDANHALFKDHLILIQGKISKDIRGYLKKKSLNFLQNKELPIGRGRKALESELNIQKIESHVSKKMAEDEIEKLSTKLQNNLTVLDSMVRSGRELNIEGDLLLLNRVNSGATIHTTGNLIVTQVVEGALRCDGNFMMITASPKANIIFHGVEVDNNLLEDKLNRVELKGNEILITPVIKKEINWAL
ncbi:MAG: hypothetical protein KAG56_02200 [Sulfurovaceae bacterium]|nr:hypothetical protein [Sulfurovaceae bacterium]